MRFALPGGRGDLDPRGAVTILELARVADELGYDCLWFGELQLRPGAGGARFQRSPIVAAAAVAAVTNQIRLGFSFLLPALHDPVRLAVDLATLDVLSGGRVNLGVGWPDPRFPNPLTQGPLSQGPQAEASLPDRLGTLLGYWQGRSLTVDGADYELPPTRQQPHPPVFVAPRDDAAISWAAGHGHGLVLPGSYQPSAVRRCLDLFRSRGGDPARVPVERFCLIAESDTEARRLAQPLIEVLTSQLARASADREQPGPADEDLDPETFLRETALIGSPETVARQVAWLRGDLGVQYINLRPSLGGNTPLEQQAVTVQYFAADVMPRFAV